MHRANCAILRDYGKGPGRTKERILPDTVSGKRRRLRSREGGRVAQLFGSRPRKSGSARGDARKGVPYRDLLNWLPLVCSLSACLTLTLLALLLTRSRAPV